MFLSVVNIIPERVTYFYQFYKWVLRKSRDKNRKKEFRYKKKHWHIDQLNLLTWITWVCNLNLLTKRRKVYPKKRRLSSSKNKSESSLLYWRKKTLMCYIYRTKYNLSDIILLPRKKRKRQKRFSRTLFPNSHLLVCGMKAQL